MGYTYSETDSGLVLAGSDEAAVRRALRTYDDQLRLVPQDTDAYGGRVYKVFRKISSERSHCICAWVDREQRALPLSMSLLDLVKSLDPNTRYQAPDADKLNAKRQAERDKDWERGSEALIDELKHRDKRSAILPRTRNPGNRRWKEQQFQRQKRAR